MTTAEQPRFSEEPDLRGFRIWPDEVLTTAHFSAGSGKTDAALAVSVRQLMGARRRHRSLFQLVRATAAAWALPSKLAATVEVDPATAAITSFYVTSPLDMDVLPYYQPLPNLLDELYAAAAAACVEVTLWDQRVRQLSLPRCAELTHGGTPNECSPCGVIRLAAPQIPRAPGIGRTSPVPNSIVLAAA